MNILGIFAAVLTTLSFLPQVIQVIKTKDTKSISLGMYSMFVVGIIFWTIYGFLLRDKPILIANLITFCLAFVILIYKIKEVIKK